ncbi:MAG TPA: hypothetical protein VFF64_11075 [Candidatus Eremiobacteraceae bacterium]|nr:hypothetical protein [Candidatus Eremiobacteraceae bacterium]
MRYHESGGRCEWTVVRGAEDIAFSTHDAAARTASRSIAIFDQVDLYAGARRMESGAPSEIIIPSVSGGTDGAVGDAVGEELAPTN